MKLVVVPGLGGLEEAGGLARASCQECGAKAAIVCASPGWEQDGFHGDGPRAVFVCAKHCEDMTFDWYWMRIAKTMRPEDDGDPTLLDLDFLLHVYRKTWGKPFLTWLFDNYRIEHG